MDPVAGLKRESSSGLCLINSRPLTAVDRQQKDHRIKEAARENCAETGSASASETLERTTERLTETGFLSSSLNAVLLWDGEKDKTIDGLM
jgi:hypothetical protein